MARRAFTLVELLVIVAIIGVMTTAAVLTITSGQTAVRVKGATRDVFAAIRQARSTALVTQKPAIITYSNGMEDGEPVAKIEITSAKLFSSVDRSKVQTITGEPIKVSAAESEAPPPKQEPGEGASEGEAANDKDKEAGRTVEEILFSSISDEVVRGVRIKVLRGDELPVMSTDGGERAKPKISVFSNVDYLLGRFKDAKDEAAKKNAEEKKKENEEQSSSSSSGEPAAEEGAEPVSVVWETNGRVEPHQVWVYPDGARPEDGQLIRVDRFGGAKVVSGDGREDD